MNAMWSGIRWFNVLCAPTKHIPFRPPHSNNPSVSGRIANRTGVRTFESQLPAAEPPAEISGELGRYSSTAGRIDPRTEDSGCVVFGGFHDRCGNSTV